MTKLPIYSKERFTITNSEDYRFWKSRNLVKLKVKYEDKIVSLYSCHMGWWDGGMIKKSLLKIK